MTKKLPFDTLELATLLKTGGVDNANVHAASLAAVITQNLYTKNEVDKMIEAALVKFDESMRRFDESMRQTHARFDASLNEFRLSREQDNARFSQEMLKMENRLERKIDRNLYTTIAALSTLFVLFNGISACLHYFIH